MDRAPAVLVTGCSTIVPTFSNGRATPEAPHEGDPSLNWTTRYPGDASTVEQKSTYNWKVGYSRNFVPS